MHYLLYILIGILGGIASGLFGIGGGVIVVPALVIAFGFNQHLAQGTMLATFILPTFFLAAWTYYKAGHINIPAAVLVALGMIVGTYLGATYAQSLAPATLKKLFGVLVIIVGLKLILGK